MLELSNFDMSYPLDMIIDFKHLLLRITTFDLKICVLKHTINGWHLYSHLYI